MKEAFVYKWTQLSTGKFYIGYHKGTIDDGYLCSSKIVRPMIKKHPEDWTREVYCFGSKPEMQALESQLLNEHRASSNPNCYNQVRYMTFTYPIKGNLNKDLLFSELAKLTPDELAEKYKQALDSKDKERFYTLNKYIIKRVVVPNSEPLSIRDILVKLKFPTHG